MTILFNTLFILSIIGILMGCTLGDAADGCCGTPGQDYADEKDRDRDRKLAGIIFTISVIVLVVIIIISIKLGIPTLLTLNK